MSDTSKPWIKTMNELDPGRKMQLEYEDKPLYFFLKERAQQNAADPFLIFPLGTTLSYGETWGMIERFGAFMQNLGVKKGDRIAIMTPNTPHYVIAHFAILGIGATVVQANPLYTEHELKHQLDNAGATGIISLTMFQDKVNKVMENTSLEWAVYGQIQTYVAPIKRFLGKLLKKSIFDPNARAYDAPLKTVANTYHFQDAIKNDYTFTEADIDIEDIAVLQYTGGTTGVSKGAMLTHRNLSVNSQQARGVLHMVPDGTGSVLTVLPLFHIFGLTACMGIAIQLGIPMVLNVASPPDFGDILKWIEKYKIAFFPGVPAMMTAIVNHPNVEKTDFSSLIAVISGGAPLPIEVAREFYKKTKASLVEGYGLSETAPLTHINPIGIPIDRMVEGSIGIPSADTEIKVVDTENYENTLPLGEVGELCIKGPQVMVGYWEMPNESKHALKDDGWFRTGDIARIDEKGYTYIVDRKKDIIIVSGYNVVPREVEEVLYKHPAVLEAAVAGMTHPQKGEIVTAWVVFKEEQSANEEEIVEFCREYLAPYKLPKQVIVKDELPKSMVGKILRRKLQEEGLD